MIVASNFSSDIQVYVHVLRSFNNVIERWREEEGEGVHGLNWGRGTNVDNFVHIGTGSDVVHQSGHRFGERTY